MANLPSLRSSLDAVFALPAGCFATEGRVLMSVDKEVTTPLELQFYQRVTIVGFYFDITGSTFGAFDGAATPPTLKDLDVRLNLPRVARLELNQRQDSPGPTPSETFVMASSLDIRNFRRFDVTLNDASATVAVSFRGRYASNNNNGFGAPVLCSVTAIWQPYAEAGAS